MLSYTFCHLHGMTKKAEEKLWNSGIISWNDFERSIRNPLSSWKTRNILAELRLSRQALEANDISYFIEGTPPISRHRIYPHVMGKILYIDIETTGLQRKDEITTIAVYDGVRLKTFVKGKNLHRFPAVLKNAGLIVTYNGDRFDIPFIKRTFKIKIKVPHLDLRPVLHKLGYRGGLKKCEKLLKIKRQVTEVSDGKQAIELWWKYKNKKDQHALKKLVAYNCQDALSLETILLKIYNQSMKACPINCRIPHPEQPKLEYKEIDEGRT